MAYAIEQSKRLFGNERRNRLSPTTIALTAGAVAGVAEALACHPLDNLKVQMQLSKKVGRGDGLATTALTIIRSDGPVGLYRGLSSVLLFIAPKMATRFASFEWYKKTLKQGNASASSGQTMTAALGAGITEAVAVVTPMEVVKIRLQSQNPRAGIPRDGSAIQALIGIVKENGIRGLYSGLGLTALRQGTNQAVNLSVYSFLKDWLQRREGSDSLSAWQTSWVGLIAGASGPCTNAPIDTLKTRLQRNPLLLGQKGSERLKLIVTEMFEQEGARALYKGILPRVLRVGPGQAVAYTVYEKVKTTLS